MRDSRSTTQQKVCAVVSGCPALALGHGRAAGRMHEKCCALQSRIEQQAASSLAGPDNGSVPSGPETGLMREHHHHPCYPALLTFFGVRKGPNKSTEPAGDWGSRRDVCLCRAQKNEGISPPRRKVEALFVCGHDASVDLEMPAAGHWGLSRPIMPSAPLRGLWMTCRAKNY